MTRRKMAFPNEREREKKKNEKKERAQIKLDDDRKRGEKSRIF